ncbi:MAG: 2-oxoacid:acceptor oxidoreductase family protein [Spirochaetota bacterium]
MIAYQKPTAFYETFERKGPGERVTHYCPGCGHGTAQKLIAEAIDTLGIQDRVVMLSPVGCAVFAYYYYDTANIQCSHGRAPAVATGVRRTQEDAIVISYQGDGDLAGIGMAEIMHAANRGEHITVFFINNAIYGMTGGQMAPTTLLGQKTATSPLGREGERDGQPFGMCEVMDALQAPVYIERVSLGSPAGVMRARKAFRTGLQNQVDRKGFSFIEVLSPCPTNWKMEPVDARTWVGDVLEKQFPIKKFRDRSAQQPEDRNKHKIPRMGSDALMELLQGSDGLPEYPHASSGFREQRIKIAGFGGQGVLSAGALLAQCGIAEGLEVSWLPSYGPEMRGGHAYASVIISQEAVGSPVVDQPNVLIALSSPALDAFESSVEPGGWIFVNSSIIEREVQRTDVHVCRIPATELAKHENLLPAANVVMAAAYLVKTGVMNIDHLEEIIPLSVKRSEHVAANITLIQKTRELVLA